MIKTYLTVIPSQTEQNVILCAGESVTVGENTYNLSGTYSDSFINSLGCDSIVITNLTINEPINATTTIEGFDIASNLSGAIYQWLNCDNGNAPIAGETNQVFTAEASGNYSVMVTVGNCIDTSACEYVNAIGTKENRNANAFNIYPNPSKGVFSIELKSKAEVTVTNLLGKVILNKTFSAGSQSINLQSQSNGIYFLKVISRGEQEIIKLVKGE